MTFIARKNISVDLFNVKHSSDDMFLQIIVARHYIEYNVSAARHSSNIAYTRNIVSMWNFISRTTGIEEIESPRTKDTRRQITECRDFFHNWIIPRIIALPIVGASRRRKRKRGINEKYPAATGEERNVARRVLHFSTSKLLPRCRPRGTLNVRIEKKVTERNSVPRRP